MKKIAVIGCSGSGKSTLAIQLNELLKIPVYHLDTLNWQPNWVPTPRDEWEDFQRNLVKKETWIIDGNYGRTLDIRIEEADTIVLLDMPRLLCISRVIKRFFKFRKSSRPDMNEGCKEKLDYGFLKWVWNYNKKNRPETLSRLEQVESKKVIVLSSPKDVKQFVKDLGRQDQKTL